LHSDLETPPSNVRVAWNCQALDFISQQPPGAMDDRLCWSQPPRATAVWSRARFAEDDQGLTQYTGRAGRSLYLTRLAKRRGPQAVKNFRY
jgi:hypothetical protein